MEANRAEAERCVEIAQKCLREGNRDKAAKFVNKADRLCPNIEKVKEMRKFLETPEDETADYGAFGHYQQAKFHQSQSTPNFEEENVRRERSKSREKATLNTPKITKKSSATQLGVDYTAEQLEAVQSIRKCRNYYEILSLEKDFAESDLKKSYRRLALQFHPDKNKTPGAAEAFKAIGNAYGVLSDAEKRRRYDLYGSESSSAPRRSHEDDGGFQAEFSPEEIFQMFFGGGFPSSSVYRRQRGQTGGNFYYEWSNGRQQPQRQEERQENNLGVLLQLMPILILVLLSLFSSFLVGEPTYSLHRTNKYTLERKTSDLRVPYWVKPDFLKTHGGSGLHRIEQQVEEDYISALRSNCFREKSQKETLIWRARTYGDAQMYEKAQKLQQPSCDRLAEMYA